MRCRAKRKRKTRHTRRIDVQTDERRDHPTRSDRDRETREPPLDRNAAVHVMSVSHGGRTRNGRNRRITPTDTSFNGMIIQPPSYSQVFTAGHSNAELVLKPPSYDEILCKPPPYPGSPVPELPGHTPQVRSRLIPTVHRTRGGNRRSQRRSSQNTTRIMVNPQDQDRQEIISPPPRYEE